jgi:beta-mannosidase
MKRQTWEIASGWQLRLMPTEQTPDEVRDQMGDDWLPASVPGTVQHDLLAAGIIPDPYLDANETQIQWVGEQDWLYRMQFDLPQQMRGAPQIDLCCAGLDTFATVWLNGIRLLVSENMFVPQRAIITPHVRETGNELIIQFTSPWREGKAAEQQHGVRACWNGDASRLYVRKAPYHYGWDWGPTILTIGPWQPVTLEAYVARIAEIACPVQLSTDRAVAQFPVAVQIAPAEGESASGWRVEIDLVDPGGEIVASHQSIANGPLCEHTFHISQPRLWWPHGHGDQPLYEIRVRLSKDATVVDERSLRMGVRRVELMQSPIAGQAGTSFYFNVNDTPIFCQGANWIPADNFVPQITPDRYRQWLELARDAHMNMLRVWGGGIYEQDVFYDLCDEMGILIWQDFMFACGMYPAHEHFLAIITAEAEAQIRRLRHHSSVALWCGNNEDYLVARTDYHPNVSPNADEAFPARVIYERRLPELCARLDPDRPYWPGSPYTPAEFGADPNDMTSGDRHTWEIWHGPKLPYQDYATFGGRFVSEFGMASLPARATIDAALTPTGRRFHSAALTHHFKADDGDDRLDHYLRRHLWLPEDLDVAIYLSQLLQADALMAAISAWRRRWNPPERPDSGGALIWQLNDCWPAISWALADYYLRPKAAYYTVRRAFASIALGIARTVTGAEVWGMNATATPAVGTLHLTHWSLAGDHRDAITREIILHPQVTTEFGAIPWPLDDQSVVAVVLRHTDQEIARATLWPEINDASAWEHDMLLMKTMAADRFHLTTRRPARGIWLETDTTVAWSDNSFDLMPDERRDITVSSPLDVPPRVYHLGDPTGTEAGGLNILNEVE